MLDCPTQSQLLFLSLYSLSATFLVLRNSWNSQVHTILLGSVLVGSANSWNSSIILGFIRSFVYLSMETQSVQNVQIQFRKEIWAYKHGFSCFLNRPWHSAWLTLFLFQILRHRSATNKDTIGAECKNTIHKRNPRFANKPPSCPLQTLYFRRFNCYSKAFQRRLEHLIMNPARNQRCTNRHGSRSISKPRWR